MCFALGIKRQVKGGWISVGDTPMSLFTVAYCPLPLSSFLVLSLMCECVCCMCLCVCGCISEACVQGPEEYVRGLALSLSALSHQTRTRSFKKNPIESRASKPKYYPVFVFHSAGGANVHVQPHLAFYIGPGDFDLSIFITANAVIPWTISLVPSWHLMFNNSH